MVGTRRSSRHEAKNQPIPDPEPELPSSTLNHEDSSSTETIAATLGDPVIALEINLPQEEALTATVSDPGAEEDAGNQSDSSSGNEKCPACPDVPRKAKAKESWVACEGCQQWYHWDCVGERGDLATIDKWYCKPCLASNPAFIITMKPPARKSTRKKSQPSYMVDEGGASDPSKWMRLMQTKPIAPDKFQRMKGSDVGMGWLERDENAMKEPVVIEDPEGLGMQMPGWATSVAGPSDFGVSDVARLVGGETPVEVIDVATQSTSPGWTLQKWADYYNTPISSRDKIRNVISLEVSGTPLAELVVPPRLVKEIDWTETIWPSNRKGKGQYPKVQLYCLMSVAQCWTDMHVDFAGSSVFYHVLKGSKVFYFIRPTKANLDAYERWSGSELQTSTWLGDLVDEVIKVELKQGHTMIIPTGWIHAVYTPEDSLVFGGNFLHSYNIATQLRVRDIEIATRVPKKFRFPFFQRMCWYAADKFNKALKVKEDLSPRVLEGLQALSDFLISEARLIERSGSAGSSESIRRDAKEQVPAEKVKDAPALAREFRWRLHLVTDGDSGNEGGGHRQVNGMKNGHGVGQTRAKSLSSAGGGHSSKRKRENSSSSEVKPQMFRNFQPRGWDDVHKAGGHVERQDDSTFPSDWNMENVPDSKGSMEVRSDTIVKSRRYKDEQGNMVVEREKITRVRETWRPGGSSDKMDMD